MSRWLTRKKIIIGIALSVGLATVAIFHNLGLHVITAAWEQAIEWNVSPLVFVGLLFATLYHYYKGWFLMARGIISCDGQMVARGFRLNRIMWAIPYLYVLAFGRGYPWWIPVGILSWLVIWPMVTWWKRAYFAHHATHDRLSGLLTRVTPSVKG